MKSIGITGTADVISKFGAYLDILKKWNKAYNISGITEDNDIIVKHFLDSLLYVPLIPKASLLNACDIGSGGGFPGVPVGIVRPEISIVLIEPSRKRAAFLRYLKDELGLKNIAVSEMGVEKMEHGRFDIAMTRALFSLSKIIATAGHVLKNGGFFIVSKGPGLEDEIQKLPDTVSYDITKTKIPMTDINRYLVRMHRSEK